MKNNSSLGEEALPILPALQKCGTDNPVCDPTITLGPEASATLSWHQQAPWLLMLFLMLAASIPSLRADALADARARFSDGEFDKSVKLYEQSLETGEPSAAVFYELGRAFAKTGKEARAALNFRRALVLDPQFVPATNALRESNVALGIAPEKPSWQSKVLDRAPMDALAMGGAAVFWLGAFIGIFAVRARRRGRLAMGILLIIVGAAAVAAVWQCDPRITSRTEALVLRNGGADLLSSPTDQSEKLAAMPEGSAVKILSQRGRWFYGQLSGGLRGWFLTEGIVPVIPPA